MQNSLINWLIDGQMDLRAVLFMSYGDENLFSIIKHEHEGKAVMKIILCVIDRKSHRCLNLDFFSLFFALIHQQ